MQLQFQKTEIPCLHTVKRDVQHAEQTQEIRISDGMPDIGSIVGAWGQVILRGKEWQDDGISVSGGTMVWVLYLPEEGGPARCVESWIPFQMRWSIADTQYDGKIMAQCLLKSVDARSTSARKMILRTNVSVLACALQNREWEIYTPQEIPEDIELRTGCYPVRIPVEAGEKTFELDQMLPLPASGPEINQLLRYHLQIQITEERIMADKLVFRGIGHLHVLYSSEDGSVNGADWELPFSQYAELEREYDEDGESLLWPCVTALETELEEAQLHIKAGVVCQYRIGHRPLIEIVEDAYSPRRSVEPQYRELELPGILESKKEILHAQCIIPAEGLRVADTQFLPQMVSVTSQSGETQMNITGQFQGLYQHVDGQLQGRTQKWEIPMGIPMGEGCRMEATVWPVGAGQGNLTAGNLQFQADLELHTETVMDQGIAMVTGLEMSELRKPDPQRPSLILRRTDEQELWDIAKETGSTIRAIQEANHLEDEPDVDQMLLIPVI